MVKQLLFDLEARKKLLRGVEIVAKTVGSTLGPKGSNVAIERSWGTPSVIHDGVSVAKEIDLEDPFENMGAQLVKEAAQKTNDIAGDGTTTATILTYAIASEALKNIAAGENAMMLKKGIEKGIKDIVILLKKFSQKLKTNEEIKQIATISAQDETIGSLIAAAIQKLGKEAIIAVEESQTVGMSVEYKEGMQFDKGWISPYFVTKPETMEAIIEEPWIVVTDIKLTINSQFIEWIQNLESLYTKENPAYKNWLEQNPNYVNLSLSQIPKEFHQIPKNIVLIANEISGVALASLIQNKVQGFFNILVVQAPDYGDKQKEILQDIATVVGGNFISIDKGESLNRMQLSDYGHAKRVVATKDSTMIVDGEGKKINIQTRVQQLEHILKNIDNNEFEKERLKERIAKLTSGIAIINVGAPSEMEMREKKERCIDAIEATKAAVDEGIIAGGEIAYLFAARSLGISPQTIFNNREEVIGYNLVLTAIKEPFKILMTNSGYDAGQMFERFLNNISENRGIDVIDGQLKEMIKAGIIDPVKVSRVALENAASCAISIMTTNSLIVEKKEKKENELSSETR